MKRFLVYAAIGVVNTAIHWSVFAGLLSLAFSQGWANVAGFLTAATFSFLANAKWTFQAHVSWRRYFAFTLFMGLTAFVVGESAEKMNVHPLVTLVLFSFLSLSIGFAFSKFVVFRTAR